MLCRDVGFRTVRRRWDMRLRRASVRVETPVEAPDAEEPMEVDAAETSADAPAATATPEVVRSTREVQVARKHHLRRV